MDTKKFWLIKFPLTVYKMGHTPCARTNLVDSIVCVSLVARRLVRCQKAINNLQQAKLPGDLHGFDRKIFDRPVNDAIVSRDVLERSKRCRPSRSLPVYFSVGASGGQRVPAFALLCSAELVDLADAT